MTNPEIPHEFLVRTVAPPSDGKYLQRVDQLHTLELIAPPVYVGSFVQVELLVAQSHETGHLPMGRLSVRRSAATADGAADLAWEFVEDLHRSLGALLDSRLREGSA